MADDKGKAKMIWEILSIAYLLGVALTIFSFGRTNPRDGIELFTVLIFALLWPVLAIAFRVIRAVRKKEQTKLDRKMGRYYDKND